MPLEPSHGNLVTAVDGSELLVASQGGRQVLLSMAQVVASLAAGVSTEAIVRSSATADDLGDAMFNAVQNGKPVVLTAAQVAAAMASPKTPLPFPGMAQVTGVTGRERFHGSSGGIAMSFSAPQVNTAATGGTPTPTPTTPSAPTITITPGNGQNSVAWIDGSNGGAAITAHNIYASTTQGFTPGSGNLVASPTGASPYVHSGLSNGTAWYYRVAAVNSVGAGAASAEGTGTPSEAPYTFTNPEAQTFVSRMSVQPDNSRKALYDNLFGSLKAGGLLTAGDALFINAGHDNQARRLNLLSSTLGGGAIAVGGGTPSFFTDKPVYYDGVDDYETLGFSPADCTQFQQDNASFAVWGYKPDTSQAAIFGTGTAAGVSVSLRNASGQIAYRINQSAAVSAGTASSGLGWTMIERTGSAAVQAYKDNAASGAAGTGASAARSTAAFNIGRVTTSAFGSGHVGAIWVGRALSAGEKTALYTAVQTFLGAIGALPIYATKALASAVTLPDGASAAAGKGLSGTGVALDAQDGTLWAGHGRGLPATYRGGISHLSADATTLLGETFADSLGLAAGGSTQGVAYDTSDNTLWWIYKDAGGSTYLMHTTKAGALIPASGAMASGYASISNTSTGLAINNTTGELYVGSDSSGTITRYSKLAVSLGTLFIGQFTGDQLWHDTTADDLYRTIEGTPGLVQRWRLSAFGAPWLQSVDTMTGADAIEGLTRVGSQWVVMNDAYTHAGSPALNRALFYAVP